MVASDTPVGIEGGWTPVGQGGTLNDRIRQEILRYVESYKLASGDRLPSERDLAATLNVSRPSVREAVRSLNAEGRLVVKHGQGVFVAEPAAQRTLRERLVLLDHSLSELYGMREVLEVTAAKWAGQRRDGDALADAAAALDRLDQAADTHPEDFDVLHRLDADFHVLVVRAAGNRLLEQTHGVLNEMLHTGIRTSLEVSGRLQESRMEHERIMRALVTGDGAAAARAARAHVRSARAAAEQRVKQSAGSAGLPAL